jgi:LmbE family N-acetylglucosaminyl deacetylase
MNRILAVATHPDDETLGCGGALLRHKADGDAICWVIATRLSERTGASPDRIRAREGEIRKVAERYRFDEVKSLDFDATEVDKYPMSRLIEGFSGAFRDFRPDTLYLPFHGDVHSDHRLVFQSAYSCAKTFRYPFIKTVFMMETLSETEFAAPLPANAFQPNWFVDIGGYLEEKLDIMACYRGEGGDHPFPRSETNIRALAAFRGAMAGTAHAEAFMLLRSVR